MQVTEKKFHMLQRELRDCMNDYDRALKEQTKAASLGDLRENEEYSTARANVERLSNRISELQMIIEEAKVVPVDNSPRISIGSTIDVTQLDKDQNPCEPTRRFTLEAEGDTVMKKVIGIESPLGREIFNGTNGIYTVKNGGGISYKVEKVFEDETLVTRF